MYQSYRDTRDYPPYRDTRDYSPPHRDARDYYEGRGGRGYSPHRSPYGGRARRERSRSLPYSPYRMPERGYGRRAGGGGYDRCIPGFNERCCMRTYNQFVIWNDFKYRLVKAGIYSPGGQRGKLDVSRGTVAKQKKRGYMLSSSRLVGDLDDLVGVGAGWGWLVIVLGLRSSSSSLFFLLSFSFYAEAAAAASKVKIHMI
uniref:Uncharacterized protein n=1 Tax=Oryza brachyantha TaxID=4533 RepID=J3MHR3_ORYBR